MNRSLKTWVVAGIGLSIGVSSGVAMDGAWAWQLGQQVEQQQERVQLLQGDVPVQMIQETSGSESRRILLNQDQRVFAIQIQSQGQSAPDPQAYLGEYAELEAETISVVPLRGRVVRYSHPDGRVAEWRVTGMSGRFSAQAISYDLAPEDLPLGEDSGVSPGDPLE